MTSFEMSIRFMRSSEIWVLMYEIASSGFLWMRIALMLLSMSSRTSRQLSRRTVSMPLQSILSNFSVPVHSKPTYLFLFIRRYG